MMNKKIVPRLMGLLVFIMMAGCASQQAILTGENRETVLAFSEAKTDNLLAGMNENDYEVFSRDFDQQMLTAMNQSQFETFKQDRDTVLGAYVSRQVNTVVKQGEFYSVIYDAVFEKDDAVAMRVVYRIADPHQISGLWFKK